MAELRIIVAEDESIATLGLICQLQELGYSVVGDATDGLEAVALCGKLKPDLVLMDINMPRMDGIQSARIIKDKYDIPVIIISGYSEESLVKEAAEAGVFTYLVKPVTKFNLGPAIEVALRNHQSLCRMAEETNQLRQDLADRKLIERAKGILMRQMGLSEEESMKRLQKMSNERNVKLTAVAREIIAADSLFRQ